MPDLPVLGCLNPGRWIGGHSEPPTGWLATRPMLPVSKLASPTLLSGWTKTLSWLFVERAIRYGSINARSLSGWPSWPEEGTGCGWRRLHGGNWVYLSAAGGLDTPVWMGSHSVNPRAGLGDFLGEGDLIRLNSFDRSWINLAGSLLPERCRPAYKKDPVLRAIPGPHSGRFTPESLERFWASAFHLTSRSDRMGYRLSGEALSHANGADLVSQGMALGEIQVPGDGQPIVMMSDHPTTGGYTCIATVARCDLPLLAQAPLGEGRVRFTAIEPVEAQSLLRNAVEQIDTGIEFPEEEWLQW